VTLSLKLLADLHLSPKTVVALRLSGYAIERVTDYLPASATDCQIIALAERLQASILTQDLDFSALIARIRNVDPQRGVSTRTHCLASACHHPFIKVASGD
jgi:predicted nuclease of predicted toxin-antitoxin system